MLKSCFKAVENENNSRWKTVRVTQKELKELK